MLSSLGERTSDNSSTRDKIVVNIQSVFSRSSRAIFTFVYNMNIEQQRQSRVRACVFSGSLGFFCEFSTGIFFLCEFLTGRVFFVKSRPGLFFFVNSRPGGGFL